MYSIPVLLVVNLNVLPCRLDFIKFKINQCSVFHRNVIVNITVVFLFKFLQALLMLYKCLDILTCLPDSLLTLPSFQIDPQLFESVDVAATNTEGQL